MRVTIDGKSTPRGNDTIASAVSRPNLSKSTTHGICHSPESRKPRVTMSRPLKSKLLYLVVLLVLLAAVVGVVVRFQENT